MRQLISFFNNAKYENLVAFLIRVTYGLMWLNEASWKSPPYFGLYTNDALYYWVKIPLTYPVFDPFNWFVQNVVLSNFILFGWMIFFTELFLGLSFVLGIKVRLFSVIAFFHTIAITLSVAKAPNEWIWSYILMLCVAALFTLKTVEHKGLSLDQFFTKKGADANKS